uniref:Reverse transcriptase domain-containing protein n=1 Tax=Solanum lycopersicum TaxID=4081 RepID=A0A3Q7J7N5_SOLLC
MAERRAKGLCYNCDEQYSATHQCKRLFLFELDDSIDDEIPEVPDDCPKISCNYRISISNGEKVQCLGVCTGVTISIGEHNFIVDLYVIPLGGFDLVLGVKWLQSLGPILWDFAALTISFSVEGKSVLLQGQQGYCGKALHLLGKGITDEQRLEYLLTEFDDLFQEPKSLPLLRQCDHRISLLPGTAPRDGSWRLCIDYHELNAKTVKDKFPIPVVDELLDELHGAKYFTKLDLCFGYHQVRMSSYMWKRRPLELITGTLSFLSCRLD